MPSPIVTVIVIAFRGDRWLPACLSSLTYATGDSQLVRVVLVDNGENAPFENFIPRSMSRCIVRTTGGLPFSEANNVALLTARIATRYVCFLNQDTVSEERWLDRCINAMESNPYLGAVSPFVADECGDGVDPGFAPSLGRSTARFAGSPSGDEIEKVRFIPATAMVLRSSLLEQTGPFDPIFGSYYEDFDLCERIRRAGFDLGVVHSSRIRHAGCSASRTEALIAQRSRLIVRNRLIMKVRHESRTRVAGILEIVLWSFPRNLLRSLLGTPSSQRLSTLLGGYHDFVRLIPRLVSRRLDDQIFRSHLRDLGWETIWKGTA